MRKFLNQWNQKRQNYGENLKVVLPKLSFEQIESMAFVSIRKDQEDLFIKQEKVDTIIRLYNKAIRLKHLKPSVGEDMDKMMDIQLRIHLLNGQRLIFWPSETVMDELVVSYWDGQKEYLKYLDSYNLSSLLDRAHETM